MMRNIKVISFLVALIFSSQVFGQSEKIDRGNLNLHFGTALFYSTYSLGYEALDILRATKKHQLRPNIRVGGWAASISGKNKGLQSAFGLTYLFGSGKHFFEHSSEMVIHFDKGLKAQSIVYIGSLYRPFLGYRYLGLNNRMLFRVGVGWKEVLQFGIGFML